MWNRSDVDEAKRYQVALCQAKNGTRTHALHTAGSSPLPVNAIFLTEIVPAELLMTRNFRCIAEATSLENGNRYWVDAHGVWLTGEELDALKDDRAVPWVNGIAARFAPK